MSSLPPGFRFHPTDEELVAYYLKKKVGGKAVTFNPIAEVDLYKQEPWDLPEKAAFSGADLEWYFFSPRDKKYPNGVRTNRATVAGYWKATGKDRNVKKAGRTVGMKKTLVFYSGRAPHGERTDWVMHEYRLDEEECLKMQATQDLFVVCRVFKKSGVGPRNGEDRGPKTYTDDDDVTPEVSVNENFAEELKKALKTPSQTLNPNTPSTPTQSPTQVAAATKNVTQTRREPEPVESSPPIRELPAAPATREITPLAPPSMSTENMLVEVKVDDDLPSLGSTAEIPWWEVGMFDWEPSSDEHGELPLIEQQEQVSAGSQGVDLCAVELDDTSTAAVNSTKENMSDEFGGTGIPPLADSEFWQFDQTSTLWSGLNSQLALHDDLDQNIRSTTEGGDPDIFLEDLADADDILPPLTEEPELSRFHSGHARGIHSRGRQRNLGPEASCDISEGSTGQVSRRAPELGAEQQRHFPGYNSELAHPGVDGLYSDEYLYPPSSETGHSTVDGDNPFPLLHEEYYDCSMDGFLNQLSEIEGSDLYSTSVSNSTAEIPSDFSRSRSRSSALEGHQSASSASQAPGFSEARPPPKPLTGLMKFLGSLPVLPASAAECPPNLASPKPRLQLSEVVPSYSSIRVSAVTVTCMSSSDGTQQVQTAVTDCCLQGDVQGVYQQVTSGTWQSISADDVGSAHHTDKQTHPASNSDATVVSSGLQRKVVQGSSSAFVFVSILVCLSAMFWILLIKGMCCSAPSIVKFFVK